MGRNYSRRIIRRRGNRGNFDIIMTPETFMAVIDDVADISIARRMK